MKRHNEVGAVKASLHNVQHALDEGKAVYFAVFQDDGTVRSANAWLDKPMAKSLYATTLHEEGFNFSRQYCENVPISASLVKRYLSHVREVAGVGTNEVFVLFQYEHFTLSNYLRAVLGADDETIEE